MKQTKLMVMAMMAVALMATSCASKKDLQNCQNENKELSSNYQATKENWQLQRLVWQQPRSSSLLQRAITLSCRTHLTRV